MNTYQFSQLPSSSLVSATVTMMVCAWFALAGGAILTDQHSDATVEAARTAASATAEIAPEARFNIVVEAKRPA